MRTWYLKENASLLIFLDSWDFILPIYRFHYWYWSNTSSELDCYFQQRTYGGCPYKISKSLHKKYDRVFQCLDLSFSCSKPQTWWVTFAGGLLKGWSSWASWQSTPSCLWTARNALKCYFLKAGYINMARYLYLKLVCSLVKKKTKNKILRAKEILLHSKPASLAMKSQIFFFLLVCMCVWGGG